MAKRKAAPKEDRSRERGAEHEAPEDSVYIGKSVKPEFIYLRLANRHGLITGATGTGKTVTLQGLAEGFSDQGVPVFCADVKGDLSGVAENGRAQSLDRGARQGDRLHRRLPGLSGDLLGSVRQSRDTRSGRPSRELGPLLLSRLMDLSEAQEGVLNIAFKIADDEKLPLIDLKDLQALLGGSGRARRHAHHEIRQCHQGLGRLDPALAAGARAAGRRALLRRAGAQDHRPDADGARRARLYQRACRRQADGVARASMRPSSCSSCRSCSRSCRKSAIPTSRSSCSSSTRRISCSRTRPRRCSRRSSRWCG